MISRTISLSLLTMALVCSSAITQPMAPGNKTQGTIPASVQYTALAVTLGGLGWLMYKGYQARPLEYFASLTKAAKNTGQVDLVAKELHNQHLATFIKIAHAHNLHTITQTSGILVTTDDNSQLTLECKTKNDFAFHAHSLPAAQSTHNNNTNYVLFYKRDELIQKAKTIDLPHGAFGAFVKLVERSIINREIEDILADQRESLEALQEKITKLIALRDKAD